MKKISFALICFLFCCAIHGRSNATLLNYNAAGTLSGVINGQNEQYTISGNVVIDDTLLKAVGPLSQNYTWQPVPKGSSIGPGVYSYNISQYSLQIVNIENQTSTNLLIGSGGSLWLDLSIISNPYANDNTSWDLLSFGRGFGANMCNQDMTPYLRSNLNNIAPIIDLEHLEWQDPNSDFRALYPFEWGGVQRPSFGLTLAQDAPVPEPATVFLLGAGLASIGFVRKRIKI